MCCCLLGNITRLDVVIILIQGGLVGVGGGMRDTSSRGWKSMWRCMNGVMLLVCISKWWHFTVKEMLVISGSQVLLNISYPHLYTCLAFQALVHE